MKEEKIRVKMKFAQARVCCLNLLLVQTTWLQMFETK